MNKTLEESIIASMDSSDQRIIPFLPYILQDFWEIGTDSELIVNLVKKHLGNKCLLKILDLGCGKGAVSIKLAKQLKSECLGIDAIPEFISFSKIKAIENNVDPICKFRSGDIREEIRGLGKFDLIIIGATGPIFGNYFATLMNLKPHLEENGLIIIDDSYYKNEKINDVGKSHYLIKSDLFKQFSDADMELIDEVIENNGEENTSIYNEEILKLRKRCDELIIRYPNMATVIDKYINQQKTEYTRLENEVISSTMVLKSNRQLKQLL